MEIWFGTYDCCVLFWGREGVGYMYGLGCGLDLDLDG
jgi:hypothetical protein